jgi:hypothetical protein
MSTPTKMVKNPWEAEHKIVDHQLIPWENSMTGTVGYIVFDAYACGISQTDDSWDSTNHPRYFLVSDDGFCLECFPEKANPPSKT